jgi:hypothetical protein
VRRVWEKVKDDRLASAVAREIGVSPVGPPPHRSASHISRDRLPDALELPSQHGSTSASPMPQNSPSGN